MVSRLFRPLSLAQNKIRCFSTSKQSNIKVAVLGAAGGIGQPLSLLLKLNPLVTQLNLYDLAKFTPGVAVDVSHIETRSNVCGFVGPEQLCDAVDGVDIIVCPAGLARKPGQTRDDLFNTNATVLMTLADCCSKINPNGFFCIITNPVNSMLPIAAEVYKKNNAFNPCRMFGISTLDIVRANRFVAEMKKLDPAKVSVPVVCGHSGPTIIPLISQACPQVCFSDDELNMLIKRIKNAGTEVLNAKQGAGTATLSMAYAGARFVSSIMKGLKGGKNVTECTMVRSDCCSCVDYFSSPVLLGKCGIEEIRDIGKISSIEADLLEKAIVELKKDIQKGLDFAKKSCNQ